MQAQILLTLSVASLKPLLNRSKKPLAFADVPRFAAEELSLRGLAIPTDLLAGLPPPQFDRFRDAADKAHCPCLVLIETKPLSFHDPATRPASIDRLRKLATAATRLGCGAVGLTTAGVTDDGSFERTAAGVKEGLAALDRYEVNLLLRPGEGRIADAAGLTELIKKVGGFRIGSLPSFGHALSTGDTVQTLRRLAPYATSTILATVRGFSKTGIHDGYDLAECVNAVRSVGYLNTLCIEFAGTGDPVKAIERARDQMAAAIETGEVEKEKEKEEEVA